MLLNFQARHGSAYDPVTGVTIPEPRAQPISHDVRDPGIQLHYAFYIEERRVGGLGFEGRRDDEAVDGRHQTLYTFDLAHDGLISALIDFKERIQGVENEFDFLRGMASGLALAHAARSRVRSNHRYLVITDAQALEKAGVEVPLEVRSDTSAPVVLADIVVPAQGP